MLVDNVLIEAKMARHTVVSASGVDHMALRLRIPNVGLQHRIVCLRQTLVPDFVEVSHDVADALFVH